MYDNYPPGVTGNEDVFGPNDETDYEAVGQLCPNCEILVDVTVTRITWNYTVEDVFTCPGCEEEVTIDVTPEQEYPDTRDEYEEMYGERY